MSGGARVPGSPRRGRRRGRSWSRSRSRSPRGRIVDDVERDRYRSRSRSRDGVHEDDRRDRAGPPGTSRDRSRDASARRERTTLTPTEPDEPDRTNRRSGFGLGYRPEEDGALRAAFGARHLLRSNFSGPRPSARASPSRRAFPAADVSAEPPRSPRPESANASSAYLLTGSLGWRASSGALPRRAETIEGVGDETLAPLAESLRDARETNRRRKETMALLEKARDPPREVSRRSSCVVLFPSGASGPVGSERTSVVLIRRTVRWPPRRAIAASRTEPERMTERTRRRLSRCPRTAFVTHSPPRRRRTRISRRHSVSLGVAQRRRLRRFPKRKRVLYSSLRRARRSRRSRARRFRRRPGIRIDRSTTRRRERRNGSD